VSIEDALPRGGDARGPGARFTVRFPAAVGAQAAPATRR